MRVEHRTGRTAVLLSLIGLIMAPGAAVAQQHDRPRIPIRVVMPSHSSITVHVADAPAQLPTRAGGDGVVITNMPASPRVTSIPVRPTAIAVESHATTAGAFPGGETTSIDEDGVAWLPLQDGQWLAPSKQTIVERPRSTDVAELAGVRAYLSDSTGDAADTPTMAGPPQVSTSRNRQLPRHASMNGSAWGQSQLPQGHGQSQRNALAPSPAQPSLSSYPAPDRLVGFGSSLGERQPHTRSFGSGDYRLGPGDQVDVFVWRNAQLSRRVPVRPDGYISLPLVGELAVAGKTAAEVEAEITTLLRDFVQVPTVTVTVTDIKSLVVYVLGRVGTPGPVTLDRNITVLQAISMAGGPTEFADQNGTTILRTIENQRVRIPYRYGDVMKGRADAGEFVLQSGDIIYVP